MIKNIIEYFLELRINQSINRVYTIQDQKDNVDIDDLTMDLIELKFYDIVNGFIEYLKNILNKKFIDTVSFDRNTFFLEEKEVFKEEKIIKPIKEDDDEEDKDIESESEMRVKSEGEGEGESESDEGEGIDIGGGGVGTTLICNNGEQNNIGGCNCYEGYINIDNYCTDSSITDEGSCVAPNSWLSGICMGCDIGYLGDPKNNITCKECPTYDKINDNGTGDTICSGNGTCQLDEMIIQYVYVM